MPVLFVAVGGVRRGRARRVGWALSRWAERALVRGLGQLLVGEGLDVEMLVGVFAWGWWLCLVVMLVLGWLSFCMSAIAHTWRSCNEGRFLALRNGCRIRVKTLMSQWVVMWLLWLAVGV